MKFNWGTGILIFLIVFLIGCGFFIAFAMNQNINLVNEEYYQKGANYSEQIEINKRSVKFQSVIYLKDKGDHIAVYFPDNFASELKSGKILFFRPSDNHNDVAYKMDVTDNVQLVPKSDLLKGRYLVQLSWESDATYYLEKEFRVQL